MAASSKTQRVEDYVRQRLAAAGPGRLLPTHRQLAKELSVSTYTIHRAMHRLESRGILNSLPGRGTVSSAKTGPAGRQTKKTVGLVMAEYTRAMAADAERPFGELLVGIQAGLAEAGLRLLLETPTGDETDLDILEGLLAEPTTAGLVLLSSDDLPGKIELARRAGVPVVVVYPKAVDIDLLTADVVTADMASGVRQLARRMLTQGHRRWAVLTDRGGRIHRTQPHNFYEALDDECRRFGLDPREIPFIEIPLTPTITITECAEMVLAALRELPPPWPTAWVGRDLVLARAALTAFERLGWAVPRDVSLLAMDQGVYHVGEHDIEHLRIPRDAMGRLAAKLLAWRTREPDRPITHHVLETRIMSGNTIGPPPRENAS